MNLSTATAVSRAMFGAGCFWGVEHNFRQLPGVLEAVSGYAGGQIEQPTYEQVCTGRTGHAEVVEVTFDPNRITYEQLLDAFWRMHDPTTKDRQGADIGSQYRSVIFVHSPEQRQQAEASKAAWKASFRWPIVTEIQDAPPFYRAEDYHQRFIERTGRAACSH